MTDSPNDVSAAEQVKRALKQSAVLFEMSREAGILLRLAGSAAVYSQCPRYAHLLYENDRTIADIDVAVLRRDEVRLRRLLLNSGFQIDQVIEFASEGRRSLYRPPDESFPVDVFVDGLDFCHYIDLRKRFDREGTTIPLADLWLSKMQMHDTAERDLLDIIVLTAEHDFGKDNQIGSIGVSRIVDVLSDSWGFFHSVELNRKCVGRYLCGRSSQFDSGLITTVKERLGFIGAAITDVRKPLAWRLRALLGEGLPWYKEVSSQDSVFERK